MVDSDATAELVARALGLTRAAILTIEPLPDAGTGGQSFVVDVNGRRLHAKRVVAGSARLVSLADELALLRALDSTGIVPAPVAADSSAGLMLTEQLAGFRPLETREVREESVLGALAGVLRTLHSVPPSVCPVRGLDGAYYRRVARSGDPIADAEFRAELESLADVLGEWPEPAVVCHGDLIAGNVLAAGDRPVVAGSARIELRLVDFEYAQLAPPVLDLASVSVMNEFDREDDRRLLDAYYGRAGAPFPRPEFAKVQRLVALTAHFWARVHPGVDDGRFLLGVGGTSDAAPQRDAAPRR